MDTTDSNPPVDIDSNLEDFEAEFFGTEKPVTQTEEATEEAAEIEDDHLATDPDKDAELEEEDEAEEEEEEAPKPKPKSKAQKRIEELVAKTREAERREAELVQRLERLEAQKQEVNTPEDQSLRNRLPSGAPDPDAVGADGKPIYDLGEFDPDFIRDLTKFTIAEETARARQQQAYEAQQQRVVQARQEIQEHWIDRVEQVEEEIPDIRESISELTDTFRNVEPQYGEYLAMAIMSSDYGPQIMHYLSQNIGEAQAIVASGPAAATRALGRLEAKFETTPGREEKRNTKRVSGAPPPPENRSRGSGGKFAVSPDTDDLDAFEREFYK